jgi:hypothetical protein
MAATPTISKSEIWPITKLKLWEKNPRAISNERFDELKIRLQRQGLTKPLIVKPDGTVIGGNMRLRALQDLGWPEVWVSIVDAKTDREMFDVALTDNEEFGYYDQQAVAELALELGYTPMELRAYELSLASSPLDIVATRLTGLGATEPGARDFDQSDMEQKLETYEFGTVKQIVVYFDNEQYLEVMERIQHLLKKTGSQNNTELFLKALDALEASL